MEFRTACRLVLLAGVTMTLSGCETMESTYTAAKEKISSIDFSLPSFGSADDAATAGEEDAGHSECPPVEVIAELNSMHQFLDGKSTREEDRLSSITMTGFKSSCKRNENNVIVDLDISFEGTTGPKAHGWTAERPSFAYPYFIAVTSPDGNIMAKEVFGVTVTYEKGQNSISHEENLRQIIPVQGDFANSPELLMGFQLTEAELAYNRSLIGTQVSGEQETALNPKKPALVYEGDPALMPATEKPQKVMKAVKPERKPAAPAAEAPAPAPTPAPAPMAESPAAAMPSEPAPAAPAPAPVPAAPAAVPPATPPSAAVAPDAAAPVPAVSGETAPAEEEQPPSIELLEEQTNAPEPPPIHDPLAAPPAADSGIPGLEQ